MKDKHDTRTHDLFELAKEGRPTFADQPGRSAPGDKRCSATMGSAHQQAGRDAPEDKRRILAETETAI